MHGAESTFQTRYDSSRLFCRPWLTSLVNQDPKNADAIARGDLVPVSQEVKVLIRGLLKRKPVERRSFEQFFVLADEVVRPVLEPDADVRPEVSVEDLAAAMKEAAIDGSGGGGSVNGSLRASRKAPQPPKNVNGSGTAEPKAENGVVALVKENGDLLKSPTSDGGKRRGRKGEVAEADIDVKAVMPQSTFKFRRAVRAEETAEDREKGEKELPPLGREETLYVACYTFLLSS
jgi:hypothetical protein